ncbi:uncharacterized protein METZ01_LOCUS261268 [marine metagenome]|uniref:Uncharacterized protein n=1 Tax=marine metagenome TaxID=408172 RepID=A0A382J8A8_9ZZZZ
MPNIVIDLGDIERFVDLRSAYSNVI